MRALLYLLAVVIGILAACSAVAAPSGVKLIVSPPNLIFRVPSPLIPGATAVADIQVQIIGPPRQPWRLTVLALGPVMSAAGAQISVSQISWRGSPGTVFLGGVLSTGTPQLCGRGEGAKAGVLRFFVRPAQETFAGNYNQKLLFSLSSP